LVNIFFTIYLFGTQIRIIEMVIIMVVIIMVVMLIKFLAFLFVSDIFYFYL